MTPKQQILTLLPKLKAAELGEVTVAIKALASIPGGMPSGSVAADGDYLIESIAQHLAQLSMIVESRHAVFQLKKTAGYEAYKKKRPLLDSFFEKLAASLGTKGNRYLPQITFLCAVALADFLNGRKILSVSTMLTQIDKIPEALDSAFPGYVESGMFGFILINTNKTIHDPNKVISTPGALK